jgi:hypothetical protein
LTQWAMQRTLNKAADCGSRRACSCRTTSIALSFNGRTDDSDSSNRGSNPWGATKTLKTELPRTCLNILAREDVLLPARPVALNLGQTADAVAFQTTMKRRTGEMRNRSLKCVEAVVQRQQRVFAKSHDDGFLLHCQNSRPWNGRPGSAIRCGLALLQIGIRIFISRVENGVGGSCGKSSYPLCCQCA